MTEKNFLDAYNEYAVELTDAPSIFSKFSAYSVLSTMVCRRVWMSYGKFPLYPNLWMIFMGRSGGMRKTTAMNTGREFVYQINPSMIMPDEFTQEGIFKTLQAQGQGTFYFSEFGAFLGM